MAENDSALAENCTYDPQPYQSVKIIMVGLCGTTIAAVSMLENLLIFYMFCTRRQLRSSHLYLAVLSVFDIFISLCYIFLMSMAIYADWALNIFFYQLWHRYLCSSFAFSHVTMTASTYLIIAATLERYCASFVHFRCLLQKMRANQQTVIAIAIGLAIFFKGTIYFEVEVRIDPNCTEPFAALHAGITPLAKNPIYSIVWRFWIRNIMTIFLPFILLAYCNAAIVLKMKEQTKKRTVKALALSPFLERCQMQDTKSIRRGVRSATRMMIMVVSCYLLSNILSVIITAWEHIDIETLFFKFGAFFTLGSDVASLLTVVASALRLPIYAVNNPQIRHELGVILERAFHHGTGNSMKSKKDSMITKNRNAELANESSMDNTTPVPRSPGTWQSAADDRVTEQRFCQAQQRRSSIKYSSSQPSAFNPNCTSSTGYCSMTSERDSRSDSPHGTVIVYVFHEADDTNIAEPSAEFVTRKQALNQ
uniref:G-protein coupled receptors family 1 profile domain-containing protein n=1 Tax=Plectus sambesii TaxID=2011161 RepID=A0A914VWE2_9BILA